MIIKLLCVERVILCDYNYEELSTIEEGDVVNALVNTLGISIEYEPNCYTMPYLYEDVAKNFISAFDEDSYNKIYKKVNNCKMFINNEKVAESDCVTIKINYE